MKFSLRKLYNLCVVAITKTTEVLTRKVYKLNEINNKKEVLNVRPEIYSRKS